VCYCWSAAPPGGRAFGQPANKEAHALFSSEKFCNIDTVALSFVFDEYCPIMD
jgi:hypothetical protein